MKRERGLVGVVHLSAMLLVALLGATAVLFYAWPVFAGGVATQTNIPANRQVETGGANVQINFTVNNTDTAQNMTLVNITLPNNVTFILNSNLTSASSVNFSNTSVNLSWINDSAGSFQNGSNHTFAFNLTIANLSNGTLLTFNITVQHADGVLNTSQQSITVVDTVPPNVTAPQANLTILHLNTTIRINVTFTDNTRRNIAVAGNGTGAANVSMTQVGSSDVFEVNTTPSALGCNADSPCLLRFFGNDSGGNVNGTTTLTVTVDSTAPTATIAAPANNSNHSVNFVFINVTFTEVNPNSCVFQFGNTTGAVVNFTNTTPAANSCTFNITGQVVGDANLTVFVNDSAGQTTITAPVFLRFLPDLVISRITWTSTNNNHPVAGDNITVNATVLASGSFNGNNTITIALFWDDTLVESATNASALTAGTPHNVTLNVTSDSLVTMGRHTIKVVVDSANNVTEANENNNFTQGIVIGYNVTILNVTFNGLTHNGSQAGPKPLEKITINASVTFGNGDAVTGLIFDNFTIYENYSGVVTERKGNLNLTSTSSNFYNFTYNATNVTQGGQAQPNLNALILSAINGTSVNDTIYRGNSTAFNYNMTAPNISLTFVDLATSIDVASVTRDNFNITLNNTGTDTMSSLNVTIAASGAGATIAGNCTTVSSLAAGASNTGGCPDINVTYSSTGTATLTFTATATANGLLYTRVETKSVSVTNSSTGPSSGGTTDGTTSGSSGGDDTTDGTATECTSNSECSPSRACVSNVCTLLECTGNQYISDHACVNYNDAFTFTAAESELSVLFGESVTTSVTIQNSGNRTLEAALKIDFDEDVSSAVATVEAEDACTSLAVGSSCTFTVTFDASNASDIDQIGVYTGDYVAVAVASGQETREGFTISVLPTEEIKVVIRAMAENATVVYNDLLREFESIRSSLSEGNATAVESLLNQSKEKLDQIESALAEEDYITANILLGETEDLLRAAREKLAEVGGAVTLGSSLLWIVAGIIVAGVVVFALYLIRSPGGKKSPLPSVKLPSLRFQMPAKPQEKGAPEKETHLYQREKGYQRIGKEYEYQKPPASEKISIGQKLKSLFRRKQKEQKGVAEFLS